ncbi:MAG: hypothetical protein IK104_05630 [Clostridia bacterium]|nr:hypothetical protein [Clostridia bacterium]
MNRNRLKLIGCVTMLIDHVGLLFFPNVLILRVIGRVSMPIFAFFIGEGCRFSRHRKKYFLTVFLLGVGCQLAYAMWALLAAGYAGIRSPVWDLNILLCFALAMPGGFLLADATLPDKAFGAKQKALLTLWAAGVAVLLGVLPAMQKNYGWGLDLKYELPVILLCLSSAAYGEKRMKLLSFGTALLIYCAFAFVEIPFIWAAFASLPLMCLYNGEPGSRKFKYAFYVFYPAHLGLLFLIYALVSLL